MRWLLHAAQINTNAVSSPLSVSHACVNARTQTRRQEDDGRCYESCYLKDSHRRPSIATIADNDGDFNGETAKYSQRNIADLVFRHPFLLISSF